MIAQVVILSVTGAVGCALRVLAREWLMLRGLRPWWGILAINLIGALAMGVLAGAVAAGSGRMDAPGVVALLGLLAGWTTYSAFAMDVVQLWLRGERANCLAIWVATMFGAPLCALVAAALGAWLNGGGT